MRGLCLITAAWSVVTFAQPVAHFNQKTVNQVLWPILHRYSAFDFPKQYYQKTHRHLPLPRKTVLPVRVLTLQDAIWLALRGNPDVEGFALDRITQKFGLLLTRYDLFEPHFDKVGFTASKQLGSGHHWTWSPTINTSLATPLGTQLGFSYANKDTYTFSATQPLLKGFGYYSHILPWRSALAEEASNKLAYKMNIIVVVRQVVQAYMGLVGQYNTLKSQQADFKETLLGLKQDALKVKAGDMAPSDYLRSKVQLESDRLNIVSTKNAVTQAYHDFLTTLGLRTDANINIEKTIHWRRYHVPGLKACIAIALQKNIGYQQAKLALANDQRALAIANNNLWPQLDVGETSTLEHHQKADNTVTLTASIPINPMPERDAALNAKIAVEKAEIALKKIKQQVISDVTTQWTAVQAALRSIHIGMDLVKLDRKTLANTKLKLNYGMTTMFEYLSTQETVLSDEITLIGDQTSYITAVSALQQTMGTTLDVWHITLRY